MNGSAAQLPTSQTQPIVAGMHVGNGRQARGGGEGGSCPAIVTTLMKVSLLSPHPPHPIPWPIQ